MNGPGRDPVLLAMQAIVAALAVVALMMLGHLVQRDRAAAAHPCPAPDHAVYVPHAGWGCAQSLTIGVKAR